MSITISSDEISLRHFKLSDTDDFIEFATDQQVIPFVSWDLDTYASTEKALTFMKTTVLPHPWYRAICLNDDRVIGEVMAEPFEGDERCRAELGILLGSKYWGRGIATRAVKMALVEIFDEWKHLERIEALVEVENRRSQRVMEKAGFLKEGVLRKYYIRKGRARDMVMYSFISSDLLDPKQYS